MAGQMGSPAQRPDYGLVRPRKKRKKPTPGGNFIKAAIKSPKTLGRLRK